MFHALLLFFAYLLGMNVSYYIDDDVDDNVSNIIGISVFSVITIIFTIFFSSSPFKYVIVLFVFIFSGLHVYLFIEMRERVAPNTEKLSLLHKSLIRAGIGIALFSLLFTSWLVVDQGAKLKLKKRFKQNE